MKLILAGLLLTELILGFLAVEAVQLGFMNKATVGLIFAVLGPAALALIRDFYPDSLTTNPKGE